MLNIQQQSILIYSNNTLMHISNMVPIFYAKLTWHLYLQTNWPGSCVDQNVSRWRWWQCWWNRWWSCPGGRRPHRGRREASVGCWRSGYTVGSVHPIHTDSQSPLGQTSPQWEALWAQAPVCLYCGTQCVHLQMDCQAQSPGTPQGWECLERDPVDCHVGPEALAWSWRTCHCLTGGAWPQKGGAKKRGW